MKLVYNDELGTNDISMSKRELYLILYNSILLNHIISWYAVTQRACIDIKIIFLPVTSKLIFLPFQTVWESINIDTFLNIE